MKATFKNYDGLKKKQKNSTMKVTSKIKMTAKIKMTSKMKNDLKNIIWPHPPLKRILPEIFFDDLSLFCYNSIHVCM